MQTDVTVCSNHLNDMKLDSQTHLHSYSNNLGVANAKPFRCSTLEIGATLSLLSPCAQAVRISELKPSPVDLLSKSLSELWST